MIRPKYNISKISELQSVCINSEEIEMSASVRDLEFVADKIQIVIKKVNYSLKNIAFFKEMHWCWLGEEISA